MSRCTGSPGRVESPALPGSRLTCIAPCGSPASAAPRFSTSSTLPSHSGSGSAALPRLHPPASTTPTPTTGCRQTYVRSPDGRGACRGPRRCPLRRIVGLITAVPEPPVSWSREFGVRGTGPSMRLEAEAFVETDGTAILRRDVEERLLGGRGADPRPAGWPEPFTNHGPQHTALVDTSVGTRSTVRRQKCPGRARSATASAATMWRPSMLTTGAQSAGGVTVAEQVGQLRGTEQPGEVGPVRRSRLAWHRRERGDLRQVGRRPA
jgi:hypothetical protein